MCNSLLVGQGQVFTLQILNSIPGKNRDTVVAY